MNKIFKVIWNHATQSWVAVSELQKAKGKTKSRTGHKLSLVAISLAAAGSTLIGSSVLAATATMTGGGSNIVISGSTSASAHATEGVAIGNDAHASGERSVALGRGTGANGTASIAIGCNTKASGDASIAIGCNTNATGTQAIAMGQNATASGSRSIAIGIHANAQDTDNVIIGFNSTVSGGEGSVAVGRRNTVSGIGNGLAFGDSNDVYGDQGVALGFKSSTGGDYSYAMGSAARTQSAAALAIGYNARVMDGLDRDANVSVRVQDSNATTNTSRESTAVGGSTLYVLRSYAASIYGSNSEARDSNLATAIGAKAKVQESARGTAVGAGSNVTNNSSAGISIGAISGVSDSRQGIAIGGNATVNASQAAVAVGPNIRIVNAPGSGTFGANSSNTGTNTFVLGSNVSVNTTGSVILGNHSTEVTDSSKVKVENITYANVSGINYTGFAGKVENAGAYVSVGREGAERQIKNVAPGNISNVSTDAINGSQLYAVMAKINANNIAYTFNVGNDSKASVRTINATNNVRFLNGTHTQAVVSDNGKGANVTFNAITGTFGPITEQSVGMLNNGTNGLATTNDVVTAVNKGFWQIGNGTVQNNVHFGDQVHFTGSGAANVTLVNITKDAGGTANGRTTVNIHVPELNFTGINGIVVNKTGNNVTISSTTTGGSGSSTVENYFHVNDGTTNQTAGNAATNKGSVDSKAGATGVNATTAGVNAKASGVSSIAMGLSANATSTRGIAIGENSSAEQQQGIAIGFDAKVSRGDLGNNGIAIGTQANASEQQTVAIGWAATASKNSAISMGWQANSSGDAAVAIGPQSKSYLNDSISIGRNATTNALQSIAIGYSTLVTGKDAIGMGRDTNVTGQSAVAIGNNSKAALQDSVALGSESETRSGVAVGSATVNGVTYGGFCGTLAATNRVVSVGTAGKERQIQNVAAGQISNTSTDAINGSQLYAVMNNGYWKIGNGSAVVNNVAFTNQVNFTGSGRANVTVTKNSDSLTTVNVDVPNLTFINGTNIAITQEGNNVTISSTGSNATTPNITNLTPNATTGKIDEPSNGGDFVNATTITNAINNAFHTVNSTNSDEQVKATNGTTTVKAGDTLDFVAGKNLVVNQTNKTIAFGLSQDINVSNITAGNITVGNTTITNGTINGLNSELKPTNSVATNSNKTNAVSQNAPTTVNGSNAATVNDVLNAGWNLQENGTAKDFIAAYDTVNFVNGTGTAVNITTENGKVSKVKVDVKVDNATITTKPDGTVTANVTNLTTNDNGTIKVVDGGNGDNLVNATTITNAINNAFHTVNSTNSDEQVKETNGTTTVKAGDTLDFVAGKNLVVNQTGKNIAFGLSQDINVTNITAGNITVGNTTITNGTISGLNSELAPTNNVATNSNTNVVSQEAPTTVNGSNAATVNDVLNAGWNLQENGTAKDFVAAYDTVNFENGTGTTVNITTENGNVSKVKVDVKVDNSTITTDPNTGEVKANVTNLITNNNGTIKVVDGGNGDNLVNATTITNAINNAFHTVNSTNSDTQIVKGDGNTTVKAGDTLSFETGKNLVVNQTGKNIAFGLSESINVTNVTANNVFSNGSLPNQTIQVTSGGDTFLNLTGSNPDQVVTAKDLKDYGWIVKADGNNYSAAVRNVNTVNFIGKNGVNVTGKANETTGIYDITVSGKEVNYTSNNQTLTNSTTGEAEPNQTVVNNVNYVNGTGTTPNVTINNGTLNVAFDINTTNGTVNDNGTVSVTEPNSFLNATEVANLVNNSSFNATIGRDDAAFTDQAGKTNHKVKAGETLTFNAGKNLIVKQDGGIFTYATDENVTFNNVNTTTLTIGNVSNSTAPKVDFNAEEAKPATNNNETNAPQFALNITTEGKPTQITGVGSVLNLTNVTTNPGDVNNVTRPNGSDTLVNLTNLPEETLNSVVTVRDIANMGWVVKATDNNYSNTVKNANEVNFVGANGVTVEGSNDGDVRTITIKGKEINYQTNNNVTNGTNSTGDITNATGSNVDNVSYNNGTGTTANVTYNNGTLNVAFDVNTGNSTVTDGKADSNTYTDANGTTVTKQGDTYVYANGTNVADPSTVTTTDNSDKIATVGDIVNTINNVYHTVNSTKVDTQITSSANSTGTQVKTGDTLQFTAAKNLEIVQDGHNITYGLSNNITVNNVNTTTLTVGNTSNPTGPKVGFNAENAKPATNNNASNAPQFALNITTGGNVTQITGVGSTLNTTDIVTNPNGTVSSDKLVDLTNATTPDSAATVRDLQNMGWVVEAEDNNYVDTVKNANRVKFNGDNAVTVTGNTTADGVRNINISVNATQIAGQITGKVFNNANGTAGSNSTTGTLASVDDVANAINGSGWNTTLTNGSTAQINPGDIVNYVDGNGTTANVTVSKGTDGKDVFNVSYDVKAGDNTIQVTPEGVKVNVTTGSVNPNGTVSVENPDLILNASQVANLVNNSSFNVTTAKNDDQVVSGGHETVKVKAGDTVTYAAGKNLEVNQTGSNITYGLSQDITVNNVNTTTLTVGAPNVTVDGNVIVNPKVDFNAEDAKPATNNNVSNAPQFALNITTGGNVTQITGVGSVLNTTDVATNPNNANRTSGDTLVNLTNLPEETLNSAVTVRDAANMGWVVEANGNNYSDTVKNANHVKFTGEGGITVNGTTDDNGVRTITVTAKADGTTITIDPNGNITANTTDINTNPDGSVTLPNVSNGGNLVNGTTVVNAINNAGHTIKAAKNNELVVSDTTQSAKVNPGKTVTYAAGKNLEANIKVDTNGNSTVTYGLSDNISVTSVQVGGNTGPTITGDANGNVVIGKADENGNLAPTQIKNVAPGTDPTDAVNVSQLRGVAGNINNRINKVDKDLRAGIAGANAAAGLPQVYIPGKSLVAVGAGHFKGENALAVGYSRASDNGKLILKLQGNTNSRGDVGGSVAVGYQW
ncbi:YadA-like family protein [Rodentibacter myodis]|uniref:Autotransporter adhesin n=1 Tax=Rodentibacter myodis TaxID=1907939 RepID=A0A1V3JQ91_9PAST|nr:YadA-like family protein [Rodentibacter myodis]OOF58832.1 hypothetical protein BKL49_06100 [Rodentibacter myodis]